MASLLENLFRSRGHFGDHQSKTNKEMAPYIYGAFQGFTIIDLEKTVPLLLLALNAVSEVVSKGGLVLFVGVSDRALEDRLKTVGCPYTTQRWIAGTLTNFGQVVQSIERLNQIRIANGGVIPMSHQRMLRGVMEAYVSLAPLVRLPEIIISLRPNMSKIALAEAKRLQIPTVGVMDTSSAATSVEFPIPSNGAYERLLALYGQLFVDVVVNDAAPSRF